jgi:glutathione synthase
LQREDAPIERIELADLDILLLRNNPSDDAAERPWAQSAGVIFGQVAARQGVMVLNDPSRLANALNKLYFQVFPEEVRPSSLITRDRAEIRSFVEAHKKGSVLKPLQGSGGQNVFMVKSDDLSNLNQIIDAILRDGYVVAQEYLPAAAEGDLRVILVNGRPLMAGGKYAAFRRVNTGGDVRSNMHAGGEGQKGEVNEKVLEIAEVVRPKLIQDGMFLVGLDIAGDKLIEVNVFSPGGIYSMEKYEDAPFSDTVIEALENKVSIRKRYGRSFSNIQLATM